MTQRILTLLLMVPTLLGSGSDLRGPSQSSRDHIQSKRPLVGAIRWDAWHGSKGGPGLAVDRSLGPEKWHSRVPFYGKVLSDTAVSIDGASQEIMDQEIRFAANAGLNFWAFVAYDQDDPMSLGLRFYLSSALRSRIGFCLITEYPRWGSPQDYKRRIERFARMLTEPGYQQVMHGRPLVFILFGGESTASEWGGFPGFRKAVDDFRQMSSENGTGNPYIVALQWDPQQLTRIRQQTNADAVGAYAVKGDEAAAPYSHLASFAERFWSRCWEAGSPVVPTVMSGWDRRPRIERPVPWETWQKVGEGMDKFYEAPTPRQLAAHLSSAITWVRANPDAAPADAVLVYAWNENDEGGWLVPTRGEGTARLAAIGRLLKR
jgi:hypothetical protein